MHVTKPAGVALQLIGAFFILLSFSQCGNEAACIGLWLIAVVFLGLGRLTKPKDS